MAFTVFSFCILTVSFMYSMTFSCSSHQPLLHIPVDPFIPIGPASVLCVQSCGSSHSGQVVITVTAMRTSRRQLSQHSSSSSSYILPSSYSVVFLSDNLYASCNWMVSLPWIWELFFFDFFIENISCAFGIELFFFCVHDSQISSFHGI